MSEFKSELLKKATSGVFDEVIGVDLDGTLCESYEGEFDSNVIGPPVPKMVDKVKKAISEGETVVVFTARLADKETYDKTQRLISAWTKKHIGVELGSTNEKTPGMKEIWDNIARGVEEDTGEFKTAGGPVGEPFPDGAIDYFEPPANPHSERPLRASKLASVSRDNATWKGNPFVLGAASLLDGVIEEVHDYAECVSHRWHHTSIFSLEVLEKERGDYDWHGRDDWKAGLGENWVTVDKNPRRYCETPAGTLTIFWVNDSGKIEANQPIPPDIKQIIRKQIKVKKQPKTSSYLAYVLSEASRAKMLETFPPKFSEVLCHHVTIKGKELPAKAQIMVAGYACDPAGLECAIVSVSGTTQRPDGSCYHVTISLDRSKFKPVDSNKLIAQGWTPISPFDIEAMPQKVASTVKQASPEPKIAHHVGKDGDSHSYLFLYHPEKGLVLDDKHEYHARMKAYDASWFKLEDSPDYYRGVIKATKHKCHVGYYAPGYGHEEATGFLPNGLYNAIKEKFPNREIEEYSLMTSSPGAERYQRPWFGTQLASVKTPEFDSWFGASKVVDAEGNPLKVYHGTDADIDAFNTEGGTGKTFGTGTFFTNNPNVAASYGSASYPVYLSLKHPLVIDAAKRNWDNIFDGAYIEGEDGFQEDIVSGLNLYGELDIDNPISTDDLARIARDKGYDGLIVKNVKDTGPGGDKFPVGAIFVAFNPSQVKNAVGNSGGFDSNNPNITAAIKPNRRTFYHGTAHDFSELKPNSYGIIWLGEPHIARSYARYDAEFCPPEDGGKARVIKVMVDPGANIIDLRDKTNPEVDAFLALQSSTWDKGTTHSALENKWAVPYLKERGIDGVLVDDNLGTGVNGNHDALAILNPDVMNYRGKPKTASEEQEPLSYSDALDEVEGDLEAVISVIMKQPNAAEAFRAPGVAVYIFGANPQDPAVVTVDDDGYFTLWHDAYEFVCQANVEEFVPYSVEDEFNKQFWENPGSLYHATESDNLESIMKNGLNASDETRGLSNRSIGASVFTTTEPDELEDGSYGDTIIEIDTFTMSKEMSLKQLPYVEQEPDVVEGELRETLARRVGLERYHYDYESGISPCTIIVNGGIAPKYLSVLGEEKMASKTASATGFVSLSPRVLPPVKSNATEYCWVFHKDYGFFFIQGTEAYHYRFFKGEGKGNARTEKIPNKLYDDCNRGYAFVDREDKTISVQYSSILKGGPLGFVPDAVFRGFKQAFPGYRINKASHYAATEKTADLDKEFYDHYDDRELWAEAIIQEYESHIKQKNYRQKWTLVPAARLIKIWQDYMKLGFVRDEKGINEIAGIIIDNINKLEVNTILCGHEVGSGEEYAESVMGRTYPEGYFDILESYFNDENGAWRISDYAMKKLSTAAIRLRRDTKAEDKLQTIDYILSIVHARSDLSGWFVQGGRATLNKMFGGSKKKKGAEQEVKPDAHVLEEIRKVLKEIRDEEGEGQCATMSEILNQKFGWGIDAGFYLKSDKPGHEGHGDHVWNVLKDGTIVDGTHDQFGAPDIAVLPPTSPEYKRYHAFCGSFDCPHCTCNICNEGFVEEAPEMKKKGAAPSKATKAERIIKSIDPKKQMVLFHSATADQDASINENWLQAQLGPWVLEVLNGATDDAELIEQIKNDHKGLVYFDSLPRWIRAKVMNKIHKDYTDITTEDLREHGQLTIVVVNKEDSDADFGRGIQRYMSDGKDDHSYYEDLNGGRQQAYDPHFGLEPGDYFSEEDVEPTITLTGDDLITFLQRNYPKALSHDYWPEEDIEYRNVEAEKRMASKVAAAKKTTVPPALKSWFGSSKVVDGKGTPLVVYHGTTSDIDKFNRGTHFGDEDAANGRLEFRDALSTPGAQIIPVYLNMSNPFRLTDKEANDDAVLNRAVGRGEYPELAKEWKLGESSWEALERMGYDGIVYENQCEGNGDSYINFHPEQVESVFDKTAAKTAAQPRILYHGAYISSLKSILSQGLIPNAKSKNWGHDKDVGMNQPSRVSYGGIYLTANLGTALNAPRNYHHQDGRMVLVITKVQPNTLLADEDSISTGTLDKPLGFASDVYNSIFTNWIALTVPGAHQVYKEQLESCRTKYILEYVKYMAYLMEQRGAPMHERLKLRLNGLVGKCFEASLARRAAHAAVEVKKGGWSSSDYKKAYYDVMSYGGDKLDYDKIPPIDTVVPSVAEGEAKFREACEKVTRALAITTRPTKAEGSSMGLFDSARVETSIGYNGANHIIAVLEVRSGTQYQIKYDDPQPWNENNQSSITPIVIHYQSEPIPEDFMQKWKASQGYKIQWLKPGEEPQTQPEAVEAKTSNLKNALLKKADITHLPTFEELLDEYEGDITESDEESYRYWIMQHDKLQFPLTIYRALVVPNLEGIRWKSLGTFWSYMEEGANPYNADDEDEIADGQTVIIKATVNQGQVDWLDTIYANIIFGDNECEINIRPRRKLNVTGVKVDGGEWQTPPVTDARS